VVVAVFEEGLFSHVRSKQYIHIHRGVPEQSLQRNLLDTILLEKTMTISH
jgi:hypothetical protein